jgi:hypothetical protein
MSFYEKLTKDWLTCELCGDRYSPELKHKCDPDIHTGLDDCRCDSCREAQYDRAHEEL